MRYVLGVKRSVCALNLLEKLAVKTDERTLDPSISNLLHFDSFLGRRVRGCDPADVWFSGWNILIYFLGNIAIETFSFEEFNFALRPAQLELELGLALSRVHSGPKLAFKALLHLPQLNLVEVVPPEFAVW